MALTLKDILADSRQFPDSVVFTLANGTTVPLGDLRSMSAGDQKELNKREEGLKERQRKFDEDLAALQLAQQETARLYADVTTRQEAIRRGGTGDDGRPPEPDPLEALERDPALKPLAKVIRAQQQRIEDLSEKNMKPIANAIKQMAEAYVNDRTADIYERVVPAGQRGDFTFDKLLKHANDNKMTTRTGIPDIAGAFVALTTKPMSAADIEAQLVAAREEGRQAEREAAALRVPRPGVGATRQVGPVGANGSPQVFKTLDEAFSAAAKDVDIWKNMDQGVN